MVKNISQPNYRVLKTVSQYQPDMRNLSYNCTEDRFPHNWGVGSDSAKVFLNFIEKIFQNISQPNYRALKTVSQY